MKADKYGEKKSVIRRKHKLAHAGVSEKRILTFKTFRKNCAGRDERMCHWVDAFGTDGRCMAKNCDYWKRLHKLPTEQVDNINQ